MDHWEQGLSSDHYTSSAHFKYEIDHIILRNWMFLCPSEAVNVGNYIQLELANLPVVVSRSENESVFAFINVCPHRGAPLLKSESGKIPKKLTCPYHGLVFNSQGPRQGDALGECNLRLRSFQILELNGMIFGKLNSDIEFFDFFAGIESQWSEFISLSDQYEYNSQLILNGHFNWKLFVEAFQECYHCPTIHKGLSKEFQLKSYRIQNFHNFSVHYCQRGASRNETGKSPGEWYWLYPNIGIPVYENKFYVINVNPVSVNRTELRYDFFTKKNCKKDIEKFIDFVKVLGKEDIAICEAVQSNLEKDAIDYSMINKRRENGVEYFYALIRKELNL